VTEPSHWGAQALTVVDSDPPSLNLPTYVGQVQARFRFNLVDGVTNEPLGEVHPRLDSPPTLTHDTTRVIMRSLSPINLEPDEAEIVNPVRDRIEPVMIIGDVEYPLGRYMFGDSTAFAVKLGYPTSVAADAMWSSSALLDEMFLVDQQLDVGFSTQEFRLQDINIESADAAIRRLLRELPVTVVSEPTQFFSKGAWPAGTQRGTVVNDLALFGDYLAPWFGHDGFMHLVRVFDPATVPLNFNWDENLVVVRDSPAVTSDLLVAPNRIVIVSNDVISESSAPIVGSYDIPASAPHSITNRGFVVPAVYEMQVTTVEQASAVAANIGQRQTIVERLEVVTPPDPRHDSYDVIRWQDINWLEIGWAMQLREGGEMRHTLRRTYV